MILTQAKETKLETQLLCILRTNLFKDIIEYLINVNRLQNFNYEWKSWYFNVL